MFHDIGLTAHYQTSQLRFEVDGANAARDFLRGHGISESDIETVWNAVALHTTPGIPEFMRPEIALVQAGAGMDVTGRGYDQFSEVEREAITAAFPREADFKHGIIDASVDASEELIREVEAADVIVIGTPMYNFTIPSALKAWIDQILRVGRTMKSTPTGKVGMLRDRPVFIGVASGAVFTGARANQPDFLTPYLTLALNSIGLKTLQFLPLQATAFLDEDKASKARRDTLAVIDLTVIGTTGRSSTIIAPNLGGAARGSISRSAMNAASGELALAAY